MVFGKPAKLLIDNGLSNDWCEEHKMENVAGTADRVGVPPGLPILKPKGNLRWKAIILLLIVGIINYLDRTNLSIAAPDMMKELHLTNTDIGLMGAVFSWTYGLMQLPSGWLVDRLGVKRVLSGAVILWSLATALTGACSRLPTLLGARFLLGVTEAPCMPTSAKITSIWIPKKERDFATGLWDSGSKFGPALSPPILVAIMLLVGWRWLFAICGLAGIIYAVCFFVFYHNPKDEANLSKEEADYITAGGSGEEHRSGQGKISWISLFQYRSVWGMVLGYFCTIWIWNIFLVFLPMYLLRSQGISMVQLGMFASIPWIGGIIGEIFGGWYTKRLLEKSAYSPMVTKQAVISVNAVVSGIAVCSIPFVHGIVPTLAVLTLALFCISSMQGRAWALSTDVAPPSMVASVGSIQNFGGYFGGAFSPIVAGMIVDATGSYTLAFVSAGIIVACAALCYWGIVRKPIEA
jgi:MFS family permease